MKANMEIVDTQSKRVLKVAAIVVAILQTAKFVDAVTRCGSDNCCDYDVRDICKLMFIQLSYVYTWILLAIYT